MLKCPSCDATLHQDFGMMTCSSCQAVLMIDINGQVQIAGDEPLTESEYEDSQTQTQPTIAPQWESSSEDAEEQEIIEEFTGGDFSDEDQHVEPLQDDHFVDEDSEFDSENREALYQSEDDYDDSEAEDIAGEQEFNGFSEPSPVEDSEVENQGEEEYVEVVEGNLEQENLTQHESNSTSEEPEVLEEYGLPEQPDTQPLDVTDFANSEKSQVEEGELMYDIFLSRLESKDQKEALRLVLLDEKLKININDYLKKIKGGQLTIFDLNPIKAKRVIEQLQYSDIEISWKQKHVLIEYAEIEEEDLEDDEEEFQ